MLAPVLVTAPVGSLVSLADAKAFLRIDHADEDDVITLLIAAAMAHLDGWTGVLGRAIITQTWRQDYARFEPRLRLPLWPVSSVTSVTWRDAAGADQTVSPSLYALQADGLGAYVEVKPGQAWPQPGQHLAPVSVTYVAGQAVENVPAGIRHAALLIIAHLYRNRESGAAAAVLPDAFLVPYRRVMF